MNDLLFDTPWWLMILLIGGGGYVWYTGNTRMEKPSKIAGIALAAVAVVLMLTSWLVVTDKEYVEQHTRQIVDTVNHRDWSKLESLLDPQTSLEGVYSNRAQIIDGARKTVDTIGFTSASITCRSNHAASRETANRGAITRAL